MVVEPVTALRMQHLGVADQGPQQLVLDRQQPADAGLLEEFRVLPHMLGGRVVPGSPGVVVGAHRLRLALHDAPQYAHLDNS